MSAGRSRMNALARSATVGAVATGLDLVILYALIDLLDVGPRVANAPALLAGAAVQLVGNKYFALGDRATPPRRQLVPFAAVEALTFLLDGCSFHALSVWCGLHFVWARVLGEAVVYVGFSFPCWIRLFSRGSSR